jgi:uncharacterized protein (DUF885 family)
VFIFCMLMIRSTNSRAFRRPYTEDVKLSCIAVLALALMMNCSGPTAGSSFDSLAEDFVYGTLALSPVSATQAGYHQHKGVALDEALDDYSTQGMRDQRQFYMDFRGRLDKWNAASLTPEQRADFEIVSDQITLGLLELDTIQNYRHNPTVYVELIGNALFNPLVLEYAPKPQRIRHIIARLGKIPTLLEQARQNLSGAPGIWTTVAMDENQGNIDLIDKEIRAAVPDDLRSDYERAAKPALESVRAFHDFLKNDLAKRNPVDWRLGREKYEQKFRYVLETDRKPDEVLAEAEADLKTVRARMLELALPLHRKMYPGKADPKDANQTILETLNRIAERHSTPETYMADAKRDLEEARNFVRAKGLLKLPPRDNLQVIETPKFMRGIYAVGGFNAAPALEPQLGAFYWITPIPTDWPKERVASKLREYNFYNLKLLTIHEAMPGHYVQMEYANDVEPRSRRLLRSVFGNGPYIEGWAQYATQMMLDEGLLDNSAELRLTFQKQELRVLANAILDIRLQTNRMTDQEALDLMMLQTFQEKEEATAKLQRAKLSSAQLPMYLLGWRGWIRVREQYKQSKGAAYKLSDFNERAIREGAAPLPQIAKLLTAP